MASNLEQLSSELSKVVEQASKSIVLVQGRRYPSSGIVWQKNLVITSDHTLPRTDQVNLRIPTGETIVASVAGRDPSVDIAILRTSSELHPVEIEADGKLSAGQLAINIGRAVGGRLLSVLAMISGTDGAYRNWRGGTFDQFIRLDTSPYPGFSGSALVVASGKVAGMNTPVFSRHFGLTVPASNIARLVERLSAKGFIGKPYFGVMMQPVRLQENQARDFSADVGLMVMGIEKGSPAELAGLLIGDIVVRLNDKSLNSMQDVYDLLTEGSIGKVAKISIVRGGQLQDLQITVGERPLRTE